MTTTSTGPDLAMVRRSIDLIIDPASVFEIRALNATSSGDRYPGILSGYFDDPDKAVKAIARITNATGIYLTLNPVNPALLARANNRIRRAGKGESTSDTDIIARRWLLIDVDPKRPSGISSTDAEHEAAIERCQAIRDHLRLADWSEPLMGDSGNGGHLLYRVDLPADDGGLIQRCLLALSQQFDGDGLEIDTTVCNAARISKVYGTMVRKGDDTPDRPHRLAKILSAPDGGEQW